MRTKLSVLALAMCGLLAFTSCDDDDNNYLPDQTVTKAIETKYPDAGKVEREPKSRYEVADFHISGNEAEAWFDNKGNWLMTKTEINFAACARSHVPGRSLSIEYNISSKLNVYRSDNEA